MTMGRVVGLAAVGFTGYMLFFSAPPGPRSLTSFDPEKLATLERDVWQANDAGHTVRLLYRVTAMLRERDRYTWGKAFDAGFHLTRAMVNFRTTRTHVEGQILPDLERVYTLERDWTDANFDPKKVARAQLTTWMARRRLELSTEDSIASLVAERDGLRYDVSPASVSGSAQLEARAALLVDHGSPDWNEIGRILADAYGTLRAVMVVATR